MTSRESTRLVLVLVLGACAAIGLVAVTRLVQHGNASDAIDAALAGCVGALAYMSRS